MRARLLSPLVAALLADAAYSESYDVVIVGSGPGGLVAAEFLTREADLSVLMLEAGPLSLQASGGTDVLPYAAAQGFTQFDVPGEFDNVAYNAKNAKYRMDWLGDAPYMWLGKLLGGCSSLNAALYFRPADAFAAAAAWPVDASDVAAGFAEIETVFHFTETPSTDGKMYVQEAYEIVGDALRGVGYSEVAASLNDAAARNAKNATFGHPPYAVHGGLRDAPAKTFFSLLKTRPNFKLVTEAKVGFVRQSEGRATGVVYTLANATHEEEATLTARGVVVLAAGALNTPALLMQSGVGPKTQLQTLAKLGTFAGVATSESAWVVNENVGQHVFDATSVYASLQHPKMVPFLNKKEPSDAIAQYMTDQSGPWATPGPVLIAYETVEKNGRAFELQTTVLPHGFGDFYETEHALTLGMFLNNPLSRDYVSFSDAGVLQVATNGSWFGSAPDDLAVLTAYVAKTITAMTASGATFLDGQTTGINGSLALAAWAKTKIGGVTHHFGGSCFTSRAASDAATRCADENFRVAGTDNIYVSDASLMKEGTVNPYGFVMYIGNQAGKNILKNAFNRTVGGSTGGGSASADGASSPPSSASAGNSAASGSGVCTVAVAALATAALWNATR